MLTSPEGYLNGARYIWCKLPDHQASVVAVLGFHRETRLARIYSAFLLRDAAVSGLAWLRAARKRCWAPCLVSP
jgi:hypothetical protein